MFETKQNRMKAIDALNFIFFIISQILQDLDRELINGSKVKKLLVQTLQLS